MFEPECLPLLFSIYAKPDKVGLVEEAVVSYQKQHQLEMLKLKEKMRVLEASNGQLVKRDADNNCLIKLQEETNNKLLGRVEKMQGMLETAKREAARYKDMLKDYQSGVQESVYGTID